ncbi:hypothetical protein [Methylomonas sp. TEB]
MTIIASVVVMPRDWGVDQSRYLGEALSNGIALFASLSAIFTNV